MSSVFSPQAAGRWRQIIGFNAGEGRALGWSFVYVFALFVAYYVMRPIRDELGVAGGVGNLPWLFTGTLLAMLAVNPLFSALVQRWPRRRFVTVAYRFFTVNLLLFAAALAWLDAGQQQWVGRAFFIWLSVFNLFVVSVFWSLMVDVFDREQGKRLFGFLAAGATLGGLAGSVLTMAGIERLGTVGLLLLAAVLLEAAVWAAHQVLAQRQAAADKAETETIGGSLFAGMAHTFRSPYLLGISAFILLYAVTSTFLYFQQAEIAEAYFSDRAARTAFFARIDLWVNGLTLLCQLGLTGRLIRRLGLMAVLCVLPLLSTAGFALLAAMPSMAVFVVVQVMRRVSNFAFARPAREVLFTLLPREDRYKAKNFIDTVIYRSGDQIGSWGYAGLVALGLGAGGIAALAVPLCAVWVGLGVWLGRQRQTPPAA